MFQIWRYLRWQETVHQTQRIQATARIQARTHLTAKIHQIQRTIATAQMKVTVANNF